MIIKCIAIDDEPPALNQIRDFVSKVPFLKLEGSFFNAIEPISFLKSNPVDLIFLDIEMEDFTGIQLIRTLKQAPRIILTTAYDEYAIEAFDLKVDDYLLKPISFERFLQAVDKVYSALSQEQNLPQTGQISGQAEYRKDYIFVKSEYRIRRIDLADILFIEGMKEYLRIHTLTEKIMTLQRFKNMEELLPDNFVRVHNSYIVALDKIETIERQRIKIGEHNIPISDSYRNAFYAILKQRKLF